VILDNVGNRSLSENRRVLAPEGRYVLIGGGGPDDGHWIGPFVKPIQAVLMSPFVSQDMGMFLAKLSNEDMNRLAELMRSGAVTPVIGPPLPPGGGSGGDPLSRAGTRARQGRRHDGVRKRDVSL